MLDVFFYEAFEEETEAIKSFLPPSMKAGFSWKTIQELGESDLPAGVVSTRTQSVFPLHWASQMSGILTRSTGYDHVSKYLKKTGKKIPCGYLPLYCNRAVAEQAMMLWMVLLRKLPCQVMQFSGFKRDGLTGKECQDKTLLVVGVGNIGFEVVKIGMGLGMRVLGVDLVRKHPSVQYTTPSEGLRQADVIVCAMNLSEANAGYFHYDLLKETKPGTLFINIARGELSPSADLLRLLQEGHLGGVGLDVYNQESELAVSLRRGVDSKNPEIKAVMTLKNHPLAVLTPHNAFNTQESVFRKSEHSIRQLVHFFEKGSFLWGVPQ